MTETAALPDMVTTSRSPGASKPAPATHAPKPTLISGGKLGEHCGVMRQHIDHSCSKA